MNHLKCFFIALSRLFFILKVFFVLTGLCENDLFLSFCGTWHHGNSALNLNVNISTGCREMLISANENSMSISGQITAYCTNSDVIPLSKFGLDSEQDTEFCLKWEPLLDMLVLEVNQTVSLQLDTLHQCFRPSGWVLFGFCASPKLILLKRF